MRPTRTGLIVGATVLVLGMVAGSAGVAAPTSAPPSSGVNRPVGFEPAAVSFISTSQGWALGRVGCADCAGLLMTQNGGRRWTALPSPRVPLWWYTRAYSSAVTDLAFADAANGFLFWPSLLTTHDGGRTWSRQSLPPVQALKIGARYAYALTQAQEGGRVDLWRTAIGSHHWTQLSLPAAARRTSNCRRWCVLRLAVEGSTVALLQTGFFGPEVSRNMLGRLWVSSRFGTTWRPRAVPCITADGGAAVIGIGRSHPDLWFVDCYDNKQSMQQQDTQHHLYRTTNAGASWVRLHDPTRHNLPGPIVDNGARHVFLATEGVRDTLVGTFDGGRTWRPLVRSGGTFFGWNDLRFLTPATGFVVGPTHNAGEHVYRTDDGGRTWRILRVA